MPEFDAEFGQDAPLRILSALTTRGRLPHALLFSGIAGLGKLAAAYRFAKALNCRAGEGAADSQDGSAPAAVPCNQCRSCRKIQSGSHPDIIPIQPAGPFIRIDQIRALCHTLAMKPYEARYRVVIVSDAQAMNPSAGNALLKVLEEPPQKTILILTATEASNLLPTVVSRCQQIRFAPLPIDTLTALLVKKEGMTEERAAVLAAMAAGSYGRALDLQRTGWIRRRNWLLNRMVELPSLSFGALLAVAARVAQDKESLDRYLAILYTWERDLAVCRLAPEKVIHRDLLGRLQQSADRRPIASMLAAADSIQAARRDIKANANPRLTTEVLLLRLADAARVPYDTRTTPRGMERRLDRSPPGANK